MLLALVADHGTGPFINASAFYVFPVALVGWRAGWQSGVLIALIATGMNMVSEWSHPVHPAPASAMFASGLLRLVVLLALAGLSASLARQQQATRARRDELARLSEHLEAELQATRAIQDLLVLPPPSHPAVELAMTLQPARILGGDAASLFLTPDGRLAITVADVSGKGAPAALAGAVLIGLLDHAPGRFHSPAETLRYLNDRLTDRLPNDMFVTLFYGLLDLRSGELVYANGGHEEPFLFRCCGDATSIRVTGMVLGALKDAPIEERRLTLLPGDLLLAYTDGATDVRLPSGERLGLERLHAQIRAWRQRPCEDLLAALQAEFFSHPELTTDDVTLVAVRYTPKGPGC